MRKLLTGCIVVALLLTCLTCFAANQPKHKSKSKTGTVAAKTAPSHETRAMTAGKDKAKAETACAAKAKAKCTATATRKTKGAKVQKCVNRAIRRSARHCGLNKAKRTAPKAPEAKSK